MGGGLSCNTSHHTGLSTLTSTHQVQAEQGAGLLDRLEVAPVLEVLVSPLGQHSLVEEAAGLTSVLRRTVHRLGPRPAGLG